VSLRERVEALNREHAELVRGGSDGLAFGATRTAAIEAILAEVVHAAPVPAGLVVAAIGTFGRRALALRSDVDLLLFVEKRARDAAPAAIDALLYPLWDAKIALSHQTLAEADAPSEADTHLATATALLDARVLAGDPRALARTRQRFVERIGEGGAAAFLERLERDHAERRERFGESVHLLEPDVKNGEGGLRDLDVIRWALRAFGAGLDDDPLGFGVARGLLDEREAAALREAEEHLHRVRNRLHAASNRRSDRLGFDAQERIAAAIEDGPPDEDVALRTERFMQRWYHHARAVDRARERVFARMRPEPGASKRARHAAPGVALRGGRIEHAIAVESDPTLPLRLVRAALEHGAPLAEGTRDAIARAAADPRYASAMRAAEEPARTFVELLITVEEGPFRDGSIVRELADLGLVLAMIPEFSPVVARVHHDVYHVLTVDAHSMAALDRLRAIVRGDLAEVHPLATRLGAEVERRRPLLLATFLHDVGKGYPDPDGSRRNHARRGADLCRTVLPRLRVPAAEVDDAARLVEQHLALYHAATRRDLDDAQTLDEVARVVTGREGLRHLYLLTLADVATTSPTALTAWKATVLDELWSRTDAFLSGARAETADAARRARLLGAIVGAPGRAAVESYLSGMPGRYLAVVDPTRLARHAATFVARAAGETAVELVDVRGDAVELCVVARDRPGTLARIAAALAGNGLEVLAANVFTRAGEPADAVDVFWVRDPRGGDGAVRTKLPRLRDDLAALDAGTIDPTALVRARGPASSRWARPTPAVRTEVVVDPRAPDAATVVEVFAKDAPGLLFRLAHALEELGLSITFSKINTEGTKVADVFYVHEMNGSKVEGKERLAEVRDRLLAAVHGESS
jgi:[protein-PII] uridylyltransferase